MIKFFPRILAHIRYLKFPQFFIFFLRTLLQPFAQKIRLVILSHLLFWSKILTVNCAFVAFLTSKKAHKFLWQKKYYLQGNQCHDNCQNFSTCKHTYNSWQYNENISFYHIKRGQLLYPPYYNFKLDIFKIVAGKFFFL